MIIYSLQPKKIYEEIKRGNTFICDIEKSSCVMKTDDNDEFYRSYKWLVKKMNQKIKNPKNIKFPIWGWKKIENMKNGYPDLNFFCNEENIEDYILLTIKISEDKVVLSDFDKWHCVLNNFYCLDENYTEEEYDKEYKRIESLSKKEREIIKEKSWDDIFNIENSKEIQATFWEISKDMIIDVQEILPSYPLWYIIESLEDNETIDLALKYSSIKDINTLINNYLENEKNSYMKQNNITNEYELLEKSYISKETKEEINIIKDYIKEEINLQTGKKEL